VIRDAFYSLRLGDLSQTTSSPLFSTEAVQPVVDSSPPAWAPRLEQTEWAWPDEPSSDPDSGSAAGVGLGFDFGIF
jgi:hypothetical protein